MNQWMTVIARNMIAVIHTMALVPVTFGTVQAFATSPRALLRPSATVRRFRPAYVQYGRWLLGGLRFQQAVDIIETAFAPSWKEIGRLAAISVIRTFVNFFLEPDMATVEKREAESKVMGAKSL